MGVVLVAEGANFIGNTVARHIVTNTRGSAATFDRLNDAGYLQSPNSEEQSSRYTFEQVDACDSCAISKLLEKYYPSAIVLLAVQSHEALSIDTSSTFIQVYTTLTYSSFQIACTYWSASPSALKKAFRSSHIFAVSKAPSGHLVNAWGRIDGLSAIITSYSNSEDPSLFPEKLIPREFINALTVKPIPVDDDEPQVRNRLNIEVQTRPRHTKQRQSTRDANGACKSSRAKHKRTTPELKLRPQPNCMQWHRTREEIFHH
ncbi:GDP-mannose 4,6-dehydratase [Microbulbifer hainanensis]|uniref:GDP-mannose 4,6-dehydratase n=1 Tax=Microbulbifer hainanensis TaxID=2735675 RepID=UPI001866231D